MAKQTHETMAVFTLTTMAEDGDIDTDKKILFELVEDLK